MNKLGALFCSKLFHRLGILRTHRFTYQDCGAVNAVFDDSEASQLTVEASVFKKLLEQVDHSNQICITASRDSFRISSFHQAIRIFRVI